MQSGILVVSVRLQLLRVLRALVGRRLYEQLVGRTLFAQFMVRSSDDDIDAAASRLTAAHITPMFAYTAAEFHGARTYVAVQAACSLRCEILGNFASMKAYCRFEYSRKLITLHIGRS